MSDLLWPPTIGIGAGIVRVGKVAKGSWLGIEECAEDLLSFGADICMTSVGFLCGLADRSKTAVGLCTAFGTGIDSEDSLMRYALPGVLSVGLIGNVACMTYFHFAYPHLLTVAFLQGAGFSKYLVLGLGAVGSAGFIQCQFILVRCADKLSPHRLRTVVWQSALIFSNVALMPPIAHYTIQVHAVKALMVLNNFVLAYSSTQLCQNVRQLRLSLIREVHQDLRRPEEREQVDAMQEEEREQQGCHDEFRSPQTVLSHYAQEACRLIDATSVSLAGPTPACHAMVANAGSRACAGFCFAWCVWWPFVFFQ